MKVENVFAACQTYIRCTADGIIDLTDQHAHGAGLPLATVSFSGAGRIRHSGQNGSFITLSCHSVQVQKALCASEAARGVFLSLQITRPPLGAFLRLHSEKKLRHDAETVMHGSIQKAPLTWCEIVDELLREPNTGRMAVLLSELTQVFEKRPDLGDVIIPRRIEKGGTK